METIHTTIGLYPNGEYIINGVADYALQKHIIYNKNYRPGRALFVDGVLLYKGINCDKMIEEYTSLFQQIKQCKDTSPYR